MLSLLCMQVSAICVMAYVAGVAVLASVAPVIRSATLSVTSRQPLFDNQSAFSNEVPAISICEPVTKSVDQEPSYLPQTLPTRPMSFLINLFHLVAFTENAMSSTSFPDSAAVDLTSVNGTTICPDFSDKGHFCSYGTRRNLATAYKDVFGCQRSVFKRTKTGSCYHAASPNLRPTFLHHLSSSAQPLPSPASESLIPPSITSPLPAARNASFFFRFETLVEPV